MTLDKKMDGSIVITLGPKEVPILRFALERASFIDTPPGMQDEILKLAEDLLKAIRN